MILQSTRLKKLGKRYGTKDFYLSTAYSSEKRTAILVDGMMRLMIFDIPLLQLVEDIINAKSISRSKFKDYTIVKSINWIKVYMPDNVTIYFKVKTFKNYIK